MRYTHLTTTFSNGIGLVSADFLFCDKMSQKIVENPNTLEKKNGMGRLMRSTYIVEHHLTLFEKSRTQIWLRVYFSKMLNEHPSNMRIQIAKQVKIFEKSVAIIHSNILCGMRKI